MNIQQQVQQLMQVVLTTKIALTFEFERDYSFCSEESLGKDVRDASVDCSTRSFNGGTRCSMEHSSTSKSIY